MCISEIVWWQEKRKRKIAFLPPALGEAARQKLNPKWTQLQATFSDMSKQILDWAYSIIILSETTVCKYFYFVFNGPLFQLLLQQVVKFNPL